MKELLEQMLREADVNQSIKHIAWLTEQAPDRMSGKGDDKKAAAYICDRMQEYGLQSKILSFETYNSHPVTSSLTVLSPKRQILNSLPCCHIASTPEEGVELELVYVGSGGEEQYEGLDVEGKAVLVEVSYAPATPEKAMLAAEHGAVAIVCMNWGRPENELICNRALKAVWGNPTPESYGNIPNIAGVSITRKDGEYLRDLCRERGSVPIHLKAIATRFWQELPQPVGILEGTEEPEKFLLVSGHLDAWYPGVTCNATGNGTMLELARVFGKFKDQIKRSICFIYWNGHEIAEAAGSTWFQDYYFEKIERNCIGYINIDSTGMKGARYYGADASRELYDFALSTIQDILQEDCRINYLSKTGDQSFFGVGVPSIAGRISYDPEVVARENGATLGYWNHTLEDGLDKMDEENLRKDNLVDIGILLGLANCSVLPYDFSKTCQDLREKVTMLKEQSGNLIDLSGIQKAIDDLSERVQKINLLRKKGEKGELTKDMTVRLNDTLLHLSRCLTNACYTAAEKYDQDSYGRTILSKPIPLLYPVVALSRMPKEQVEYKLLYTKMLRRRNRVADALHTANDYGEALLALAKEGNLL